MKRTLSLFILFTLVFTLVSCGQKEFIFEEDSGTNFLGNTFTVYSGTMFSEPWLSEKRERGGSASHDRFLDRIEQIEKDYNVKIRNEHDNIQTKILAMTLNGGGGCDMIHCGNDVLYNFYTLGILTPFEEIGVKDNKDEKFGIPSLLVEGTFDGTQFGITNYLGDSTPSMEGLITINMELLRDLAMTDPHEYAEKGEWNWENFRAFLEKIKFNDGDREWRGMGLVLGGAYGGIYNIFPFVLSNGGSFVKQTNGRYSVNVDSPEAMEAYDFIANLGAAGLLDEVPVDDPAYISGEKWMLTCGSYRTSNEFNIAQIRYPFGPSGNKDAFSVFSSAETVWSFPIFSAYTEEEIGEVSEYLFEPLSPSVYPNGWKDVLDDNVFYYPGELEYYITAAEHAEFIDMDINCDSAYLLNGALIDIKRGTQSPSAAIDSIIDVMSEEINENYNK